MAAMLLTITATTAPATDLGYLLHKNPARVHGFDLSFGHATVFYPEATVDRCTVCLLLEVDPIGLVPLVKKIGRLEKCKHDLSHFHHIAAFGGDVVEMSTFGRRRLAS